MDSPYYCVCTRWHRCCSKRNDAFATIEYGFGFSIPAQKMCVCVYVCVCVCVCVSVCPQWVGRARACVCDFAYSRKCNNDTRHALYFTHIIITDDETSNMEGNGQSECLGHLAWPRDAKALCCFLPSTNPSITRRNQMVWTATTSKGGTAKFFKLTVSTNSNHSNIMQHCPNYQSLVPIQNIPM